MSPVPVTCTCECLDCFLEGPHVIHFDPMAPAEIPGVVTRRRPEPVPPEAIVRDERDPFLEHDAPAGAGDEVEAYRG